MVRRILALFLFLLLVGACAVAVRTASADEPVTYWVRTWQIGPVLDQGAYTPYCVGYAWAQWEATQPGPDLAPLKPLYIYHEAQKIDEWPGEKYAGTSIEAGARVLVDHGKIISSTITITSDYEAIRHFMLYYGPVVIATPWAASMNDPDSRSFVHLEGQFRLNHAVLCYDIRGGSIGCVNSEGASYGRGGTFRIFRTDMEFLLDHGAYAVLAVKQ